MKKLTAGIFSVLLGLVSVGGANAAVVSTEYLSEVLQTELAKKQDTLTIDTEVKANSNNLVTSGAVSNAISAANTGVQNLQKTVESQGSKITGLETVVGDMQDDESGVLATAKTYADNIVSGLASGAVATNTANIATLNGDATTSGSVAKAVADAKTELQDSINLKADKTALETTDAKVVANETAIATEKSAREAADAQLQGKIDLKADAADVYSKTEADAMFEAQAAATEKLQAAKDYADAQIKTLTDNLGGTGEDGSSTGLTGVVASQGVKIAALEDKVGDKSVVDRIAELDSSDTAVDKEFVTAVSENDGVITVSRRALAAADIPVIAVSQVEGLQDALDAKQVSLTGQEGVIVIANGVVSIAAKGIGTEQLADKAVTSDKIADNAVTAGKIATDAVTEGTIADAAVVAGNLAANAVVEGNIAAGAVKNDNISDGELSVAKVQGLQASLNAKFEVPAYTTTTQNGTYVLTATELDGKVTYAWENIAGRDE